MQRTILAALALTLAACAGAELAEDEDTGVAGDGTTTTALVATTMGSESTVLDAEVEAWCDIERPRYEFDPTDPADVQLAFDLNLAFHGERAENPPPEIAEATQAMVTETERFIGVLEEVGWDLEAAGSESEFPPEAQAADDAIVDFEVEYCGIDDPRQ